MSPTHSALRANVDRLVLGTRVVLVGIVLAAVAIDSPARPGAALLVWAALAAHLAFAIALLARATRSVRIGPALARGESAADALLAGILLVATRGPSAAALSILVFLIVNAGLRRSARTALLTGSAVFVAWCLVALAAIVADDVGGLAINRVVVSALVLALSTVAVAVLAVERDRLLASLAGIADWPVGEWNELDDALFDLLCAAADLLPARRIALVWPDSDEPWTHVAVLDDELTVSQLAPGEHDHIVGPVDGGSFAVEWCAGQWRVSAVGSTDQADARESFVSPELIAGIGRAPQRLIAVPAHAHLFNGSLLVIDPSAASPDVVLRTEIVARQVAVSLDLWFLSQRIRADAVREERARVWRDLHDGVLQSLTGLALTLARADALVDDDPSEVHHVLGEAAALVHDEQRDLRLSILEQKAVAASVHPPEDLPTLLAQLAERFDQVWDMRVELEIDSRIRVGPVFALQIARMVQEALSNSARHGRSTLARVSVTDVGQTLHVVVQDNGRGFPFIGTFDFQTLLEQRLGPVLLKDRVQRLHGTMDIRSARTGVGLEIRIPRRAGRLAG
ncbi:MAG TPA: histidine kinase [Gemmatimonadaceae bacterium]|nr:histidine kinase [Gemmatimonadaceae bacterium]